MSQYVTYTDSVDTFRDGVRSGAYVVDKTLTITGFAGAESTDGGVTGDWINLQTIETE
jgi:nitrous oxidase accessory protein NosD